MGSKKVSCPGWLQAYLWSRPSALFIILSSVMHLYDRWLNRDKLRADICQLSRHSTTKSQTSIATSRQRLSRRIDAFHTKGSTYLGDLCEYGDEITLNTTHFEEDNIMDAEDQDSDGDISDAEDEDSDVESGSIDEEDDEIPDDPERRRLAMPSALGKANIVRLRLNLVASQELELRKGQANDALEDLRLALGHKAILWRTKVRTANNNKQRTRAWDDIKTSRRRVEKHVRNYHWARRALMELGADAQTLSQYKAIRSNDLRLSGDILDPSRLGQRCDTLAWFWSMGTSNLDQGNSWMDECELLILWQQYILT